MVGGGLDYSAPFQRAIELIGKRWTGAVVKALIPAPARFNQLLSGIPGISDRVLTERLRELETEGIVERLVDPGPPVRVSYRLTSRGRALEPVLASVSDWAECGPTIRRPSLFTSSTARQASSTIGSCARCSRTSSRGPTATNATWASFSSRSTDRCPPTRH